MISITPTAMGTWHTCPRQFHAKYVSKELQYVETVHTRFGIYVHKALEERLKRGTPLSLDLAFLEPLAATLSGMRGLLLVEAEVCINRNMQPVTWWDKSAWQRAKADAIIVDVEAGHAIVVDWKTSKGKTAKELERFGDDAALIQERVLALCTGICHQVNKVTTVFVYPFKPGKPGATINTYYPADQKQMGPHYMMCTEFEMAQKRGQYPAKPSGLCKAHCDVRTCDHNQRLPEAVREYIRLSPEIVHISKLTETFGEITL